MDFETVKIGNAYYARQNDVMGTRFAMRMGNGWGIFLPVLQLPRTETLEEAMAFVASGLDTWYTAAQAAARLVEMDVFDEPPSAQRVTKWCREGLLPGAFKLLGPGARGGGGTWRIPASALPIFAERRKQ